MHENDNENRLLTAREMAHYYAIGKGTLLRWVRERGCPVVRLPQDYRFDPVAVANWLENLGDKSR